MNNDWHDALGIPSRRVNSDTGDECSCEMCRKVLPPTDLMQEIAARWGMMYKVINNELALVPLEDA